MSDKTKIEWSDATWNPITGCTEVSAGCDNCYAKTFAERWRGTPGHYFEQGFDVQLRPFKLTEPLRWQKPRRIFVNSMSDLFHDDVPDEYIARVWQVMGNAPQHRYQILTKRHGRMRSWVNRWYAGEIAEPYEARPIAGYPGYFVTTHGEVLGKRVDTRGGLTQEAGEQGHRRVTMHRQGSARSGSRELVHRLVLTAFVRPPRSGEQACHRNGDPSDNRLSNLYWGEQSANWRDRLRHGNGRAWSKLTGEDVTEIRARNARGESSYAIARDFPVSDTQIRNVLTRRQWSNPASEPTVKPPARSVLSSVWLGVSVEDQKWADIRIPVLLDTPAAVRWLSCEPLLGPVDLSAWLCASCEGTRWVDDQNWSPDDPGTWRGERSPSNGRIPCGACNHGGWGVDDIPRPPIDWVVVGGESGPRARPMDPDWARFLRDQCRATDVPFFFKQWGEHAPRCTLALCGVACNCNGTGGGHPFEMRRIGKKLAGRELDGHVHNNYPVQQVQS